MKNIIQKFFKTIFVFFVFTILLSVNTHAAGWTQLTLGKRWYSAIMSDDSLKIVAASNDGYIYTSTDSGVTWTQQMNSLLVQGRILTPVTSSGDLTKIIAFSVDSYGSDGYLYLSTDSGVTWTKQVGAGQKYWYSITSSTDGMKLAAINGGYIYTSNDGGVTWTEQTSVGQRFWASITSSSDGLKLFAIDRDGYIYKSIDGGINWSEQVSTSNGQQYWNYITSSANGSKLIALKTEYLNNVGIGQYIYISTDMGATWTQKTDLGLKYWQSITLSQDGQILSAIDRDGYTILSQDGGINWTTLTTPQTYPTGYNYIDLSSTGNKMLVVNRNNDLYIYGDIPLPVVKLYPANPGGGFTANVNTNNTERGFEWCDGGTNYFSNSCTYNASTSEIGTFTYGDFAGSPPVDLLNNHFYHYRAFATNEVGTSYSEDRVILINFQEWTEQTSPGKISDLAINASGTSIFGIVIPCKHSCSGNYLVSSVDGGVTWNELTGAGGNFWNSITSSADGMNLAAAVYGGYIYTSNDGGLTWTEQTGSGQRNWGWKSITSSADGMNLAAAVNGGYIYTSNDGGLTWTEQTGSGQNPWTYLDSSEDGMNIVAVSWNPMNNTPGYIYKSNDGGVNWTQTNASAKNWTSITSSADGMNLAAAVNGGYIYTSNDGGLTWTEQTGSGDRGWTSIDSSNNGKYIIAASGDSIYKSVDGGINWSIESVGNSYWNDIASSNTGEFLVAGYSTFWTYYNSIPEAQNVIIEEQ